MSGNKDTSCPFVRSVLAALMDSYEAYERLPPTVTAHSPTTHREYRLQCSLVERETYVECTTGTAAVLIQVQKIELPPLERKERREEAEAG